MGAWRSFDHELFVKEDKLERICSQKQSLFNTVVKAQKNKEHQQPQPRSTCGNNNQTSAMLGFCAQAKKNF